MNMQARIKELDNRHALLETQIAKELTYPSHDPVRISELKRRKLALKEEIISLKNTN